MSGIVEMARRSSGKRRPYRYWGTALLLALSLLFSAHASAEYLGTTTLLLSGDPALKYDVVIVGDGFTADQQDEFNDRARELAEAFLDMHPFLALRSAFNIHRVNVASAESGTDTFENCQGTDQDGNRLSDPVIQRDTAMNAGYCGGGGSGLSQCVRPPSSDDGLVYGFTDEAPDDDIIFLIVNDPGYGGCYLNNIVSATLDEDFTSLMMHEFGHAGFDFADEYNHSFDTTLYTGRMLRSNMTTATTLEELEWRDLVLPATEIPTRRNRGCEGAGDPPPRPPDDIVGTFEGGSNGIYCGAYRSQWSSIMLETTSGGFNAVSRREIIRTIRNHLGTGRSVVFNELLIRNDEDPGFARGRGEIFFEYELTSIGQQINGRWPAEGEEKIGDEETVTFDVQAGVLGEPPPGAPARLILRVRESDWPDPDDVLEVDTVIELPPSGDFSIDSTDYRLEGTVHPTAIRVLLDTLHIKRDADVWPAGRGDIYVEYTVTNGEMEISGRWPQVGKCTDRNGDACSIDEEGTEEMAVLAAALPAPAVGEELSLSVRVFDRDRLSADDLIGEDTFTFDAASGFGGDAVVHIRDRDDYRITFSIVVN